MAEHIVGIAVLAAGLSRRFGAEDKLLMPIQGKPMLTHVLQAASGHPHTQVCAVVSQKETEDLCRKMQIATVVNPHPQKGQSSSVSLGVQQLSHCSGILFLPGDMPFLTQEIVDRIITRFRRDPAKITAGFDGSRYSPVLFPKTEFSTLMSLTGDTGGRILLQGKKDCITTVSVPSHQLQDIDTKEDL